MFQFGNCIKNVWAPLRSVTVRDAIFDLPKIENFSKEIAEGLNYSCLPDSHYQRQVSTIL